jgi:serine/threonine-protein phosphatase PP1 catalytic subunit
LSQEAKKEGMRDQVQHLRLDTDHHIHGRRTHFVGEGNSITIGTASKEQAARMGKEHAHITDTSGLVADFHGRITFEKDGTLSYTHLTDKPTFLIDADRKPALTIREPNLKIAIDPSQTLALPDHTRISFMVPKIEVKISEPEKVAPKRKVYTVNEIFEMAEKNASASKTFLDHSSEKTEREKEAGKRGMTINRNMEEIMGGIYLEGSVVHLRKQEGQAILIGDLHSSPDCLRHILEETKFLERVQNKENVYLVFLGDYADRNKNVGDGIKVVQVANILKDLFPSNVVLLPGNHELPIPEMQPHEFPIELAIKFGDKDGLEIYLKFRKLFEQMPIAVKMDNGVFITHGGAANTVKSLYDVINPSEETKFQMTWNDPKNRMGYSLNSERGYDEFSDHKAFIFGENELNSFLNIVGSRVMVRAHEQKVQHDFNGKCLTLNSTDYKNATKAYAVVDLSQEIYNTNQIKIVYF